MDAAKKKMPKWAFIFCRKSHIISGDFGPKNDEITNKYMEAVGSGDGDIIANTLKEILLQGGHLYEDLELT